MKYFLPLLFLSINIHAQTSDTIYVSTNVTTTLIFPDDVILFDIGTEDYGGMKSGNLVLLKAAIEKAPPTSFLVQYGKSNIYHSTICYKKNVTKTIIDLRKQEIPQVPNQSRAIKDSTKTLAETIAAKRLNILMSEPGFAYKTIAVSIEKIDFSLTNMMVDEENLYLKFLLNNKSKTDYIIDFVEFIYVDENKELKNLDRKNVYPKSSNNIEGVRGKDMRFLGYVIPVFNLSKQGLLEVILREKRGTRVLKLTIPYTIITNAKRFK